MQSIKNILTLIFLLLTDTVFFSIKIVRKIMLPGKYRKGNLLSTAFILFLGVSERVMIFEKNVSVSKRLLTHRYIRQSFIIAASLLFLLTSFEWNDTPDIKFKTAACQQTETQTASVSARSCIVSPSIVIDTNKNFSNSYTGLISATSVYIAPRVPVFLRVRNIRI